MNIHQHNFVYSKIEDIKNKNKGKGTISPQIQANQGFFKKNYEDNE